MSGLSIVFSVLISACFLIIAWVSIFDNGRLINNHKKKLGLEVVKEKWGTNSEVIETIVYLMGYGAMIGTVFSFGYHMIFTSKDDFALSLIIIDIVLFSVLFLLMLITIGVCVEYKKADKKGTTLSHLLDKKVDSFFKHHVLDNGYSMVFIDYNGESFSRLKQVIKDINQYNQLEKDFDNTIRQHTYSMRSEIQSNLTTFKNQIIKDVESIIDSSEKYLTKEQQHSNESMTRLNQFIRKDTRPRIEEKDPVVDDLKKLIFEDNAVPKDLKDKANQTLHLIKEIRESKHYEMSEKQAIQEAHAIIGTAQEIYELPKDKE